MPIWRAESHENKIGVQNTAMKPIATLAITWPTLSETHLNIPVKGELDLWPSTSGCSPSLHLVFI